MNNKTKQEQWIDEVMGSLDGLQRPPADPGLHGKVMDKLRNSTSEGYSSRTFVRIAAVAVLLLVINIVSAVHFAGRPTASKTNTMSNPTQVINDELSTLSENSF